MEEEKKRKLYVLVNFVYPSGDYLFDDYDDAFDPDETHIWIFESFDEVEKKAKEVPCNVSIYNSATYYVGELSEPEILELTGFEDISQFNDILSTESIEYYGDEGEGNIEKIARKIMDNSIEEDDVKCVANYDFDQPIEEGSILIFWQDTMGGREFFKIRYSRSDETHRRLAHKSSYYRPLCDILLTPEEVKKAGKELKNIILGKIQKRSKRWAKMSFKNEINNFIEYGDSRPPKPSYWYLYDYDDDFNFEEDERIEAELEKLSEELEKQNKETND